MHTLFEWAMGWFSEVLITLNFVLSNCLRLSRRAPVSHTKDPPHHYTPTWLRRSSKVATLLVSPTRNRFPLPLHPSLSSHLPKYDMWYTIFFYVYTGCQYVLVLTFFYIWIRLIFTIIHTILCIIWWWFFMVKIINKYFFRIILQGH